MINKLLPPHSHRRRKIKELLIILGVKESPYSYRRWARDRRDKIGLYPDENFKRKPLISIIVPAFNTPEKYLLPCVQSVVAQTYPNWELVIVNASTKKRAKRKIDDCRLIDQRIKVITTENKGISANTNIGAEKAGGEYLAFMDHDDILADEALQAAVKVINRHPQAGLIYTDEDKLSEDGQTYQDPHLKPDWSPELLTHVNYITHFVVLRKDLFSETGGLDPDKDGAQDYDLMLRVTDLDPEIRHIPEVLYHWRIADKSTAQDFANKPHIRKAGERALRAHFKRRQVEADVKSINNMPGFYKINYPLKKPPTVIVPPFGDPKLLKKYLLLLYRQGLLSDKKVIVPPGILEASKSIVEIEENNELKFLQKALEAANDRVVIVTDFVVPDRVSWAEELTGVLNEPGVKAVAPVVCRRDGIIEDCGVVNNGHEVSLLFKGLELGETTVFGNTAWTRNVDALTGAAIALRSDQIVGELTRARNVKELLYKFSLQADGRNVVWTNTVVRHARMARRSAKSRYYNPNIVNSAAKLQLVADDQQIMDGMMAIEEDLKP